MYVQLTMAERLKDLRVIDKKLTLEHLAEQTGLSKSALGKYENEDCGDINHYAIQKLAKFYGVSTDYVNGKLYLSHLGKKGNEYLSHPTKPL